MEKKTIIWYIKYITVLIKGVMILHSNIDVKEICNGVEIIKVNSDKFKTNEIAISFGIEADKNNVSANALAIRLVASVCKKYPSVLELNKHLAFLYGASVQPAISRVGKYQVLTLGVSCLDDRFALDGKKISEQSAELLSELIFNPKLDENGVFYEEDLNREKNLLIQSIQAEENDKRLFALHRLEEEMFENENFGVNRLGYIEDIERLTCEDVKNALDRILSETKIMISVVGSCDFDFVSKLFENKIASINRNYTLCKESENISFRKDVKQVVDRENVKQGKLVLGFRVDCDSESKLTSAMRSAVDVFGGGPYSKLFANVREKMSLCYYCSARYIRKAKAVIVQCGCEEENMDKAIAEILNQLEQVKQGNFKSEFEFSKVGISDSVLSVKDTPQGIESWCISQIADSEIKTPEQVAEENNAVTFEDVKKCASLLKLDTVYRLVSESEAE